MGFSLVMPYMAMYLVETRGATGAQYGTIYLVAGIIAALTQAVGGELADRYGRRRVMISALVVRCVNMVLLGFAVLHHATIPVLGVLIITNGMLRAFFEPAASAAVTELVPPSKRTAAYGLQRMGVNFGWALGPALGGMLASSHSYGSIFFASAGVMTLAALATAYVTDLPRKPPEAKIAFSFRRAAVALREHRAFLVYLGLVFLGSLFTMQIFSTFSVFAKTELHLPVQEIGLLYTVNGVLVLIFQVPAVIFIERGGPTRALVLGPLLHAVAFLAIGLSSDFPELCAAMVLVTAAEVIFAPAVTDMAAHLGDPRRLGRAFGLFGLTQQLGLSCGPLVGGLIYDNLRHHHLTMWGSIAGAMLVVSAGYIAFARYFSEKARRAPGP
jgi:predicted MFS family arabinose efflux permease